MVNAVIEALVFAAALCGALALTYVLALRFVARVDKKKEVHHLFATQDVARYHPLQFVPLLLSPLGVTITWEVDKMPLFIY